MANFIRVANRVVNLDMICYIDFLDSGRAMIFMNGLTQEKQNIPVDPEDARKLKAQMDAFAGQLTLERDQPYNQPKVLAT